MENKAVVEISCKEETYKALPLCAVPQHQMLCWGFRPDAVVASADAAWWMSQGDGTVQTRAGSLVDFLL